MSVLSEYWDKNVSNWKVANHLDEGSDAFFKEVERYRFEKLDYLEQVAGFSEHVGEQVLDVGCGLATDLSRFADQKALVTGIDVAPRSIELAEKNFAFRGLDGHFEVMNGESMTFPNDTFDFIYCHTVLHFTPNPLAMVNEIHRVLKPNGKALLMTINRRSWLYFMHRVAGMKIDYMDAPVFHKLDPDEFADLVNVFAHKEIGVYRFPVRTEVHKGWKAEVYNRLFVDLYNILPTSLIGNTGYHLVALVEKAPEPIET